MKAAAHLCGSRVTQVLDGDCSFIEELISWGFSRVQINATSVNGVDISKLDQQVPTFLEAARKFPSIEFILQKNDETRPLWEGPYSSHLVSLSLRMRLLKLKWFDSDATQGLLIEES